MCVLIFEKKLLNTKYILIFEKKKLLKTKCVLIFGEKNYWTQKVCFDCRKFYWTQSVCFDFLKKSHWTQNACFDFRKKLLNTKCVFWFSLQLLSETHLILRSSEPDMTKHVKCPLFLSDFNETLIFSQYFRKNTQIPNFIQNPSSGGGGGGSFYMDRQTWQANSRFSSIVWTCPTSHCSRKAASNHTCPCIPFDSVCSYRIVTTGPVFRAAFFFQNTGHRFCRPTNCTLLPISVCCAWLRFVSGAALFLCQVSYRKNDFVIILWATLPNS